MKKILLSLLSIGAVAVVAVAATGAFFSDTETSTGNTFTAGQLDLKIDSEAHYAGLVCTGNPNTFWQDDPADPNLTTRPDLVGDPCGGTWNERDLTNEKFFNLTDIKPGDDGENTISLHVINNDAWGRLKIENDVDAENGCGGEEVAVDPNCGTEAPPFGEMQNNMQFFIWLDEGGVNGFQCAGVVRCTADTTEGDNIQQGGELTLVTPGTLDEGGETLNIYTGLIAAYTLNVCTGDGSSTADCPGLTSDGHMVGSITYYFGLGWELPDTVGNDVQTDSLTADLKFEVEQYRNNPTPFAP